MDLKSPSDVSTYTGRTLYADARNDSLAGTALLVLDLMVLPEDSIFGLENDEVSTLPTDLSGLGTAELGSLCDRTFQEMNEDFPRFGAKEDYEAVREELQRRSEHPTQ